MSAFPAITFTVTAEGHVAQVCMTHKMPEHVIEGFSCWCNPAIQLLCSECEHKSSDCWKCGGEGWVASDAASAEYSDDPSVVVHNDFAKR